MSLIKPKNIRSGCFLWSYENWSMLESARDWEKKHLFPAHGRGKIWETFMFMKTLGSLATLSFRQQAIDFKLIFHQQCNLFYFFFSCSTSHLSLLDFIFYWFRPQACLGTLIRTNGNYLQSSSLFWTFYELHFMEQSSYDWVLSTYLCYAIRLSSLYLQWAKTITITFFSDIETSSQSTKKISMKSWSNRLSVNGKSP